MEDDQLILQDDDSFLRDSVVVTDPSTYIHDDDSIWDFRELSDSQKTILAILPIPSAILSVIGSSVIIYMAYLSRRERPWTPYHRLLVAMSVYDIITSVALGSAAFMNNKETSNKAWAMGNDSTCTAMGFLNQLAYSGTLYNAALSYYFLLTVRFGKTNKQIAQCIEPFMHIFNVGFPMLTGFVGLILGVYSESETNLGCWVNRYPKLCAYGPDGTGQPCLSAMIGWIFGGWIGLFTLFSLLLNNFVIWLFTRRKIRKALIMRRKSAPSRAPKEVDTDTDDERSHTQASLTSSSRTRYNPIDSSQNSISSRAERIQLAQQMRLRLITSQAFLFVASYVVSNIISYFLRYIESQATSWVQEKELPLRYYPLMVLQAILLPLQGLFNMMVYIRPKLLKNHTEFPEESPSWHLKRAIWGSKVEPVHSALGSVKMHYDSDGSKMHYPLGKNMISSLTNDSTSLTLREETTNVTDRLKRSRRSSAEARMWMKTLGVIGEIPEPDDSSDKDKDNEGSELVDKPSSCRSTKGTSATMLMMDGSLVEKLRV